MSVIVFAFFVNHVFTLNDNINISMEEKVEELANSESLEVGASKICSTSYLFVYMQE